MGFTTDPQTSTATTVAGILYTQALTCDLDLQSLLDATNLLMSQVTASGLRDMRKVSLTFTVVLVLTTPTALKIVATWTAPA